MKRFLQRRKPSKAVPRRSKLIEKPKRKPLRAAAKRAPAPRLPSQRLATRRRQATKSLCSGTCSSRASNKLKQKPKIGKVGKKRLMQNSQATPKAKTIKKRSAKIRKTKPLLARRADAPGEAPPAEGAGEPADPRSLRPANSGGPRNKETKLERSRCFESAYSAICEYFVTEVNPSAFSKLLAFFNNELREPFFGLLLKKFYVRFQKTERFKDLHLLKNFFTRLKYCKGLMALEKVEEQQKPAATDARNK